MSRSGLRLFDPDGGSEFHGEISRPPAEVTRWSISTGQIAVVEVYRPGRFPASREFFEQSQAHLDGSRILVRLEA